MAVRRMDFLVDTHQNELLREARDQRLSALSRTARTEPGTQSGGMRLASFQVAVRTVVHDARSHHLHRHHVGHHA